MARPAGEQVPGDAVAGLDVVDPGEVVDAAVRRRLDVPVDEDDGDLGALEDPERGERRGAAPVHEVDRP